MANPIDATCCDGDFRWSSAARTDVGLVRSRNEDACLAQPQHGLWAVADGMGGHAFGDLASRAVVDALADLPASTGLEQAIELTRARLDEVNAALREQARARQVPVMGSTVVVLLACGPDTACLWAGDSRVYLYRQGSLQQLTRDHNQAEERRARGLEPGPGANLITRALGAADAIECELVTQTARDGDLFLLCSDGLSNMVAEPAIAALLACGDCAQAAHALVDQALANGGRDNVTVVVVRLDEMSGDRTAINPAL